MKWDRRGKVGLAEVASGPLVENPVEKDCKGNVGAATFPREVGGEHNPNAGGSTRIQGLES